ncbi:MAG: hypothetical protein H6982_03200 [Chromatiales bacterium]|nr:hypothetical protein [Chromatiales bacterium]
MTPSRPSGSPIPQRNRFADATTPVESTTPASARPRVPRMASSATSGPVPDASGGAPRVVSGEVLEGTDTIEGSVVVLADGTIAPGHSPGILPILGDLTVVGGLFEIEVAGTALGYFDQIHVTGEVYLEDAFFDFSFIDGFVPIVGDAFAFLLADGGIRELSLAGVTVSGLPDWLGFSLEEMLDEDTQRILGMQLVVTDTFSPREIYAPATAMWSIPFAHAPGPAAWSAPQSPSPTAEVPAPLTAVLLATAIVAMPRRRRRG